MFFICNAILISMLFIAVVNDATKDKTEVIATVGDEKVSLYSPRSSRENSTNFVAYRAWKGDHVFSVIDNPRAVPPVDGKCLTQSLCQRMKFILYNQSHLAVDIFNITADDKGIYFILHQFKDLDEDDIESVTLKVEAEKPTSTSSPSATQLGTTEMNSTPTDNDDKASNKTSSHVLVMGVCILGAIALLTIIFTVI